MSVKFHPHKILRKMVNQGQLEKLITQDFRINREVLKSIQAMSGLSKKELEEIAIKTLKQYKKAYAESLKKGMSKAQSRKEAFSGMKDLKRKINNDVIYTTSEHLKNKYKGKKYKWLPSDAKEPDPLHQLKYGKIFTLGKGEAPQDRYGCKCSMEILVDDNYTV